MKGKETVRYPTRRPDRHPCLYVCPGCGAAEWHPEAGGHPVFCIRLAVHDDRLVKEMRLAGARQHAEAERVLTENGA